jgi:hypothetical protein
LTSFFLTTTFESIIVVRNSCRVAVRNWCPFTGLDVSSLLVDEQCGVAADKNCAGHSGMSREFEMQEKRTTMSCCAFLPWSLIQKELDFANRDPRFEEFALFIPRVRLHNGSCPFRSWDVVGNRFPIVKSKTTPILPDIFLRAYSLSTFDVRRSICFVVFISTSSFLNRAILASRRSCCSKSSSRKSLI